MALVLSTRAFFLVPRRFESAVTSNFGFAGDGCRLRSKTGGHKEFTTKSTKDTKNGIR